MKYLTFLSFLLLNTLHLSAQVDPQYLNQRWIQVASQGPSNGSRIHKVDTAEQVCLLQFFPDGNFIKYTSVKTSPDIELYGKYRWLNSTTIGTMTLRQAGSSFVNDQTAEVREDISKLTADSLVFAAVEKEGTYRTFYVPATTPLPEEKVDYRISKRLQRELIRATSIDAFTEEDFYRINSLLFKIDIQDSLYSLKECYVYKHNISFLTDHVNPYKRVLAYRLIGVAEDPSFNTLLLERLDSDEDGLLKTWNATALMCTHAADASRALFRLFSSPPEDLPIHILLNMYVKYDTVGVKKTCMSYVDSKKRNEQILAIQVLSGYESNPRLHQKLLLFLDTWDIRDKGWVISSMSLQKMGNLKPVLEPYTKVEDLHNVILRALDKSPTESDQAYAKKLKSEWGIE